MSTTNSFEHVPFSTHRRTGFWAEFNSQDRRRLLGEDLQAGKIVSCILGSIVIIGALMMLATVLIAV